MSAWTSDDGKTWTSGTGISFDGERRFMSVECVVGDDGEARFRLVGSDTDDGTPPSRWRRFKAWLRRVFR